MVLLQIQSHQQLHHPLSVKKLTVKAEATATVDKNGRANFAVSDKAVTEAIKKAQVEAKKNGTEKSGEVVHQEGCPHYVVPETGKLSEEASLPADNGCTCTVKCTDETKTQATFLSVRN